MYGSVTKKSQPCIDYMIRMILDDIVDASTSGTYFYSILEIFVIFKLALMLVTLIVTLSI